ncbi:DUF3775 domain-containing protein [Rhodoplanes sp. TEM]|uniref:DUF3775 domain-containing protein n=1 Tax=Rhodoplanes tepidamans TaxID=200616 RepID=A0ABT5JB06_RHOTP|nr:MULTISPECIES: DUF3775 domain-containing protein [Rhodoplanes]MDC7786230.1 DUF3775 domain-containing protein [Rhodoplanes tepidamans]MDC7982399.1 DUF3775 domain-containing protein [Rhodoplanes sp. TEM]MDQ0355029.1 hypothetical protein [Rhodoplanes tepidamans]
MITVPALTISPEKVCYVIMKAREFEVQDVATDGDDTADESGWSALDARRDDPTYRELKAFIRSLNQDEQVDLVALTWLGRGDGSIDDWEDLRAEAARAHNKRTADYLLAKPLLPDHLEDALDQFGCSCDDYDLGHF